MSIDAIRARWAGRDNAIRAGIPTSYREAVNLLVMAQEDTATLFRTLDALTAERDKWQKVALQMEAASAASQAQRLKLLVRVAELQAALEAVTHFAEVCETDRECERGSGRPPTVFSDEIVAARAALGKPE